MTGHPTLRGPLGLGGTDHHLRCIPITRRHRYREFECRRRPLRLDRCRQAGQFQELHPGRWRRQRDRHGCRGGGRQVRAHPAHRTPGPGSTALGPALPAPARPIRHGTYPGRSRTSTPATSTTPASSPRSRRTSRTGPTGQRDPIGPARPTVRRGQADLRGQTERHVRTGPRGAGLRRTTAPAAASARHPARPTVLQTAAARAQAHPHAQIARPHGRATTAARVARPRHNSRQAPPRPAELIPARVTRSHRLCRPGGDCTRSLAPPLRALRPWDLPRRPVTGWLSSAADRQRSRSPTPAGKAARRTWARSGTARCRPCPAARLPRSLRPGVRPQRSASGPSKTPRRSGKKPSPSGKRPKGRPPTCGRPSRRCRNS
jgi:hypothetical protein